MWNDHTIPTVNNITPNINRFDYNVSVTPMPLFHSNNAYTASVLSNSDLSLPSPLSLLSSDNGTYVALSFTPIKSNKYTDNWLRGMDDIFSGIHNEDGGMYGAPPPNKKR